MRPLRGRRPRVRGAIWLVALALASVPDTAQAQAQIQPTPAQVSNTSSFQPTTAALTVQPTLQPVAGTTEAPVPLLTEAPVPLLTEAPTQAPLDVVDPTEAPVPDSEAPISFAPTSEPVADPTLPLVTLSPTFVPTSRPTVAPADSPVTFPPTLAPTLAPTSAPSVTPTLRPSRSPVVGPTTEYPTVLPTLAPSGTPTVVPTSIPTREGETPRPTRPFGPEIRFSGTYVMELVGVGRELDNDAQRSFADAYDEYLNEYYAGQTEPRVKVIRIFVEVVSSSVVSTRRRGLFAKGRVRRELQDGSVDVTYDMEARYTTDDRSFTSDRFLVAPFNNDAKRDRFAAILQKSDDYFGSLTTVTAPSLSPSPPPQPVAKDNTMTIIIAVCASVGGFLVLLFAFWCFRRNKKRKEMAEYGGTSGADGEGKPPSQLQLSTLGGPDEVSTLAEPTPRMGVIQGGESLAGYGDQSVATVDYDYSKAYGGGGDSIVSETGGTLGSGTRGGGTAAGAGPSAAGASQSIFSDSSFSQLGGGAGAKEELIDIYAPPGKLGVVIDTPDDGPPVVHAIKDSSVIADQLKVGDKLVAVDDEDVRSMTAIKVSKIISRKSANPTRKLSVIRTSVG